MATISSDKVLTPMKLASESSAEFGKDRMIGLELETTRNYKTLPNVEGVEWETSHWSFTGAQVDAIKQIMSPLNKELIAMVGRDGGDIEIATQPMTHSYLEISHEFKDLIHNMDKYCIPDDESGTHIHISKLKTDKKVLWRNLYWFSVVFDRQLYAIFRRTSNWARSPRELLQSSVGSKPKMSITDAGVHRYPIYGNKGTIIVKRANTYECRGGSASTDYKEIKAWALMFYNIVEFCNQTSIVGHRFEEVLPENDYGEILKQRLTTEQLRQIVPIDVYKR